MLCMVRNVVGAAAAQQKLVLGWSPLIDGAWESGNHNQTWQNILAGKQSSE